MQDFNYTYYKRKISSGEARGKNREKDAVIKAVEKISSNNKEICVSIISGKMLNDNEITTINFFIQNKLKIDSKISFDTIVDEEMGNKLQVIIYEVIKNTLDVPHFLKIAN